MTDNSIARVLTGHDSPDTAYVVDDYPYGFKLRTSIRYWIETKKGHGQRFVSQTVNPKTGHLNKPKASTYSALMVMYLNEQGHVQHDGLSGYADDEKIDRFEERYAEALTDNRSREAIRYFRAGKRASKNLTWSVSSHVCTPGNCDECRAAGPRQTIREQAEIVHKMTILEMHKETEAAIRGEEYP